MSVFLNNVDDFILPSQACINPLVLQKAASTSESTTTKTKVENKVKNVLSIDSTQSEFERVKEVKPDLIKSSFSSSSGAKVATVSLNDCLACSGCVTSAEAVLINQQSYSKLLEAVMEGKVVVVAISPQSLASLADLLRIGINEAFLRLAAVLKAAGVRYVTDLACAGDVALTESVREFLMRYHKQTRVPWQDNIQTTVAASATAVNVILSATHSERVECGSVTTDSDTADTSMSIESPSVSGYQAPPRSLPLIVSACPGWVCYAEKTNPQTLPYLSSTKSPQQILGVLVRRLFATVLCSGFDTSLPAVDELLQNFIESHAQKIVFVSIQPCFDKKLEGSRLDFFHDDWNATEVDLVLSTTECWNLLEHLCKQQSAPINTMSSDMSTETEVDSSSPSVDQVSAYIHLFEPDTALGHGPVESLLRCYSSEGLELIHAAEGGSTGAGSGGYVDFIANHLQRNFIKCDNSSSSSSSSGSDDMSSSTTGVLELHAGRNPDISEIHLLLPATHSSSPATIIKFGRVYGFRNIQSMLLKLKRQKLDLDFIEVMACPSGCVNGGGQIKTSERETNAAMKDRISRVDTLYHSRKCASLDDSPLLKYLYGSVLPHQSINQEASPVIGSATPEKTYNGTGISREWADKLFHTRFHAVPKLEILSPLTAKW